MSHQHAYRDEVACVEIDEHVCLQPINGGGEGITSGKTGEPVPEYLAGFMISHDRDGFPHRCEGFVRVHPEADRSVWTMVGTLEGGDLTLTPSILCTMGSLDDPAAGTRCGFHGYVRDGKWVPA
ncbi:MAG TPA: hypothetical protein VEW95_05595 [Candidatus Limnocylindrales bacterium]|nr:hypothetical protein [Candidatus Limnocylindrales bacterium]